MALKSLQRRQGFCNIYIDHWLDLVFLSDMESALLSDRTQPLAIWKKRLVWGALSTSPISFLFVQQYSNFLHFLPPVLFCWLRWKYFREKKEGKGRKEEEREREGKEVGKGSNGGKKRGREGRIKKGKGKEKSTWSWLNPANFNWD